MMFDMSFSTTKPIADMLHRPAAESKDGVNAVEWGEDETFKYGNNQTANSRSIMAAWALASVMLVGSNVSASAYSGVSIPFPHSKQALLRGSRDLFESNWPDNGASIPQADAILSDLGRLVDGWSGPESKAPSENVRQDVTKVLSALSLTDDNLPEVEVDDDDGSVTLVWPISDDEILTIDFTGSGKAFCTYTHRDSRHSQFKSISADNDLALTAFLDSLNLEGLDLITA